MENAVKMTRLTSGSIEINEPLKQDFFDEQGKLLLCQGYRIQTNEQLQELVKRGLYFDPSQTPQSAPTLAKLSSFETWATAQNKLAQLLQKPPLDSSFTEKISKLAKNIREATLKSSNAAIAAMMLADYDAYPISHSFHVALLANLLAHRLKWSNQEIDTLVCAALTMNIAMIRIQGELCHLKGPLNDAQKRSIEIHPTLGVALLERLGVQDKNWLQAVQEHHESPGGGGYPGKIENPCEAALIIRTCDIFSAKISPRAARKPMDAAQAAKVLFVNEGIDAKNPFSSLLIKEVGIYPPGCIVQLSNQETAIVLRRGQTAHTPIVQVLKTANNLVVVDSIQRDTAKKPYTIQKTILKEEAAVAINAEKLWP